MSSESSSDSPTETELTVGELKDLIEMNIKAIYAFDKVRLFLAKRIEKSSGQVLYGAGVAMFASTTNMDVILKSSGRRRTIESALKDILEQTMAKLSEEMLFPKWCIKESNDYLSEKSGLPHTTFPIMSCMQLSTSEMASIGNLEQAVRLKELIQTDLSVNIAALYASRPATKLFICKRGALYVAGVATPHTCGHGSVLLKSTECSTAEDALESLLEETAKELTKDMNF
ncbi:hypothetical protein FGADI_4771 [Fusarium gaditjirri]|uniref:Uncharacterized protein n=1 Tax=Fusarium gaditjirri TaxID=282569 RepID=A0A8H4WZ51_9HYPO|nr:hypothetical protein FGADI_4771 [Fusarium gaditjirri]